jgi:acetyl-CoA acetyltransferase
VCYHPCESVCNRANLDSAVSIHSVERFLGDLALERGWLFDPPRTAIGSFGRSLRDVPPTELGATAARVAIARAELEPDQNEAFAAQSLAVDLDLDLDSAKVNPTGGAIALGHPIAATGAIITTKILSEMEREDHELGLSRCASGAVRAS